MDCRVFMSPVKTRLYADQPAGAAIDFMRTHHIELVPVVDRDDKFVGLLSAEILMRMLLPRSIGMMRGIKHASYLRETPEDLQKRLNDIRLQTTGDLVSDYAQTVHPDSALTDALLAISERQYIVPVVDDEGRLIGAISYFSIMHAMEAADQEGHSIP